MGWLAAGDTYEVALVEGRVVARSRSGKSPDGPVGDLPAEIRDHPEVSGLERFAEWLERHAAECAAQVTHWMVSSLPVPAALLARVWPDEAWRAVLRDVVVVADGPQVAGFLRDVDEEGGLRLTRADGGTVRLTPRTVTMPHPVLLPDLERLRAFAAESGVSQGVDQLHRATWHKPEGIDGGAVTEFAGAEYRSWYHLSFRATSLGYRVSGMNAVDRIRDAGRIFTASVGIGDPYTEEKAWTGALTWRDEDGNRALPLTDVGPVAWSEGMRMAAALHAGGTVAASRTPTASRPATADDGE
ncbi:DUF4132 domain-containing protein [Streptomyces sp. NPDC093586]|uniref:DUF4132 domain-containing protein n=1 Tax=Streptomyces sp. NPDC093586 TaxID=3366042 RepID=UPI0037F2B0A7